MGRVLRSVLTAGAVLVLGATSAAHHGPAVFDLRKEVTLTGVITAFRFRNPHLPSRRGTLYGWSAKSLARSDHVAVVVNPPQQRTRRLALGRLVLKSDGTTLRIPWDRQEIRERLRDEADAGR